MDDRKARDAGRSYSTIPRSATQRVPIFVATHKGIGIAGGLRRQVPSEGNNHSRRHLSCIPFRKAECAAMRDLIRGSLINMNVTLQSVITCPHCGTAKEENMPTDACQFFYECSACHTMLRPKTGDCCVFCSYGSMPCPSIQVQRTQ